MLTLQNTKRKNYSILLTEKNNTAALIGINLYSVLFYICSFNFSNALLNTTIVPENKALFDLSVYYVYL